MTTKPSWLERNLDTDAVQQALGHHAREFALLWLVFSILDMLIGNKLSWAWGLANVAFTLVLWLFGAYINFHKPQLQGSRRE